MQTSGKRHSGKMTTTLAGFAMALAGACGVPGADVPGERGLPPAGIEARTSALTLGQQFGYNFTEPGGDYNRCVKHASTVLNRMNAHGENIGFHYQSAGYTDTNDVYWHAQSIVRLPFYSWDWLLRGQFFVEDIDHGMATANPPLPDQEGHLGVARLDFTGGNNGLAIGSNKTFNDWTYGADWNTAPNPGDSFVPVNGTPKFHVDEAQNHVGGMSGIGWHVAIALQQWAYSLGGYIPSTSVPIVKIFDHWSPESPQLRQTFTTWIDQTKMYNTRGQVIGIQPTGNDATAITKLRDGRFLLAVEKGANLSRLEFYVSQGTNLDTPGTFDKPGFTAGKQPPDATWPPKDTDPRYYPGWTSMNFITDCDSSEMFVLGFNGNGNVDIKNVQLFQDSATAYHVTLASPTQPEEGMTPVASKPMACTDNLGHGQCSLLSSAGSYIDPAGRVVFYVMGGDDDGCVVNPTNGSSTCVGHTVVTSPYQVHGNGWPTFGAPDGTKYSASTGYMRGMEFHERHGNYFDSSCPTIDTAWVELYENANFNSAPNDTGRNYHIDGPTHTTKPSFSLGQNGFDNMATSVRWCLPPGYSYTMWDSTNWSGAYHSLSGTGTVRKISTFAGKNFAHATTTTPMDNRISSVWLYNSDDPSNDQGVADDSI